MPETNTLAYSVISDVGKCFITLIPGVRQIGRWRSDQERFETRLRGDRWRTIFIFFLAIFVKTFWRGPSVESSGKLAHVGFIAESLLKGKAQYGW